MNIVKRIIPIFFNLINPIDNKMIIIGNISIRYFDINTILCVIAKIDITIIANNAIAEIPLLFFIPKHIAIKPIIVGKVIHIVIFLS